MSNGSYKSQEQKRLNQNHSDNVNPWNKWGPYISERSWGTVREDCSENRDPWGYFPHSQSRSKAYQWGEDGIAGWCDRFQILAFAPAFWNEKDSILKERLFGTNFWEGNHGEDVKECYYHLDGTPTHSYMKYLYKYPQNAFPYEKLVEENKKRSTYDKEYELIDTGIFSENRYFDITIEYAKASPEDTCIRIEAINRGPDPAPLHILPHLWFRNQWDNTEESSLRPQITCEKVSDREVILIADEKEMPPPNLLPFEYKLQKRYLYAPSEGKALFTHNDTKKNKDDLCCKDAFHQAIIEKKASTISNEVGTKSALHYSYTIQPQKSIVLYLRLSDQRLQYPLQDVEKIINKRKQEADEFYSERLTQNSSEEERKIQRQAIAGILWSKQIYLYDVSRHQEVFPSSHNDHWRHLKSMRIMLMPDKWEYPWFAAWDLAFQTITLALVDIKQAKEQLWYLLFDQFQHPNGQIPAYEWEFSELNPPVQAWAVLSLMDMEEKQTGKKDIVYLKKCFHKLILNFTWWVNKVDTEGYNVFEGGFLGLDNITVIDRLQKGGKTLEQSDGTGWMAFYSLGLMRMALIIAKEDKTYEALATKFFQHFVYIAHAMKRRDHKHYELWSEKDGFFYDIVREPNGHYTKLRIRSLIGLIPLYAIETISKEELEQFPEFAENFHWFNKHRTDLTESCIFHVQEEGKDHHVLSIVNARQLKKILHYVWDPNEFRANFGLRSLSKYHKDHPFTFEDCQIGYEPEESLQRIKGGNSNWRGPVWFPTSYLFIETLKQYHNAFGKQISIQVGDETPVNLEQMAQGFAEKMTQIFKKDANGNRPYLGEDFEFKNDPNWIDNLLFYEHYHPETGRGLGASHQTGWSALIANLIEEFKKAA